MSIMGGINAFEQHVDRYDRWFDENRPTYWAEINALRRFVPPTGFGVEIGVGTGRFAVPLGIKVGVEPAGNMAKMAKARGIAVCRAVGERLPFRDAQFDFALLVTVVCFVEDVVCLLRETSRVIKVGGRVIIGFIDKASRLGQLYESRRGTDRFYQEAHFYTAAEMATLIQQAGFGKLQSCQTLLGIPDAGTTAYQIRDGYGEGAFVVISAVNVSAS